MLRPLNRLSMLVALFAAPTATLLVLFAGGFVSMSFHRRLNPPDTPLEFTQIGLNLVSARQTTAAIKRFNQALAIDAEYAPAIQGTAVARLYEGKEEEADQLFQKAIAIYQKQGEPIAITYIKVEQKALEQGRSPICLHYVDKSRLLCSPV